MMYLITTMSFDELGRLIRDKRVSLDNSDLLVGYDAQTFSQYFTSRLGSSGYVVGLRGRINNTTANVFSKMDRDLNSGGRVILEAEISDDLLRFKVTDISRIAEAMEMGFPTSSIFEDLDTAQLTTNDPAGIEVLCVPYISLGDKVRVTSLAGDINFDIDDITFVELKGR